VGELFNIGSTDEVTILDLARKVLDLVDAIQQRPSTPHDQRITFIPYEQAYAAGFEDMRRRIPDISKIQAYVGWQPELTLDQILQDVIAAART
jgi:UDP-glucose 4-epimerase